MEIIATLLSPDSSLDLPNGFLGWVIWIGLIGLLLVIVRKWRSYDKPMNKRYWGILLILSLCVPLTSLFIGIRLPASYTSPPPGVPLDLIGPVIMVFAMIPWMLAGGILGPSAAAGLGILSGLMITIWEGYNPYTPIITGLLATLFAAAMNQRYRTSFFNLLRHPLAAALILGVLFPFIYLITNPFATPLPPEVRLQYTLTQLGIASLITGIGLFIGGLFTEIIALAIPEFWGGEGQLIPSPTETSLQTRLMFLLAPLVLILVVSLLIGDWYFAGKAARSLYKNSLANIAEVTSQNVPNFMEMGQILIQEIANDPNLINLSNTSTLSETLATRINKSPYFNQLLLFDSEGELVTAYPNENMTGSRMPMDEEYGVDTALQNFPIQIYSIPSENKTAAQISFIVPITDEEENVKGAIVGRTNLSTNLQSQPIISSLKSLIEIGAQGFLLDHEDKILYHPNEDMIMSSLSGLTPDDEGFYDGVSPYGTQSMIYVEPVEGYDWSVVIMIPKDQVDQLSVSIAIPLLIIIVLLSIIGVIILRIGLRSVRRSLTNLATGAGLISVGEFDKVIPVAGEDEIGQLGQSFEQMRVSVKRQLEKLNKIASVSQGVASSLQIEHTLQSLLNAALSSGAGSARIVFPPETIPTLNGNHSDPIAFEAGPSGSVYRYMDNQLLAYAQRHDRLVLSSLSRPRLFNLPERVPHPASIIALSLSDETSFLGVFWVAYDQPHTFSNDEVNYMADLASQASRATINTRQYMYAELERQQLSAVVSSSPDPILVTNPKHQMVMANPIAWKVLNIKLNFDDTSPIDEIISQKELVTLIKSPSTEPQTIEVTLPDRKVYLATANPVISDGKNIGRICILTDVTRLKELSALKSEFVSTVSHDMRYPLTLIQGYASMVDMVGQLNEQQTNYLNKIIENVEAMSRLVNNLLDLRRIEAGIGLHIELVQVREIIEKVIELLDPQAKQKKIKLTMDITLETVPLIEADQALLQKAIYNLVENAIKYTSNEGKVNVLVHSEAERIYFEINDTGIGISPVDQAQLFEKFYHRPKKEGLLEPSGSGLGLAIVKSISDRHNGKVWVESQLGRGSTFYLVIPLRQSGIGDTIK